MADVGRHGSDVARLHGHARAHRAGVAILDLPMDLVAELHEPLHAVVAMDDGQDVLLGRRTVEARLADRHDRGIPRHVRAGEIREEVEGHHLVLEAGLGAHLRLVLRHVAEVAVHRKPVVVGAQRLVAGCSDHPLGRHAVAGDRLLVAPVLRPECETRLRGARERIEAGVRPVVQDRLEHPLDERRRETLGVIDPGLAVVRVEPAGEEVHRAVVIHGPDDGIEVHDAVEEAPRDVALKRAQERVDRQHVPSLRPHDVREVFVPTEAEAAEREGPVAVLVGLDRTDLGERGGRLAHATYLLDVVWQMSAQRSMVSAPARVWSRRTPGCGAWNW